MIDISEIKNKLINQLGDDKKSSLRNSITESPRALRRGYTKV